MIVVPPGGFAGMAQQVPAVRNRVAKSIRGGGGTRKRRAKTGRINAGGPRRRKIPKSQRLGAKKKAAGASKLKKGSAAAKAWGAKMKRLRKKK